MPIFVVRIKTPKGVAYLHSGTSFTQDFDKAQRFETRAEAYKHEDAVVMRHSRFRNSKEARKTLATVDLETARQEF